ncbi:toxin-antitoxin system HepN family antidote component (plasmid) [Cyanobacterium sp. HL-69]|nr:toxin-antitoxin system HepN family antidote component [Cyanobacterium sp. HL-69]
MSRSLILYLRDIITSIDKIKKYTFNLTYEELLEDEKTLESVVYNLMIIGEATKKIPPEIRIKYSYI